MKLSLLPVSAAISLLLFLNQLTFSSGIDDSYSYLSFDQINGSVIPDQMGGHSGEISGDVSIEEGKIGAAIKLGEGRGRVDWGNFSVNSDGFAIACWFKADDFDIRDARIISKGDGLAPRDHDWMISTFRMGNKVRLGALVKVNNQSVQIVASREFLVPHIWYHVVLVYNGSEVLLYLDGERIAQRRRQGSVSSSNAPIAIGNEPEIAGERQFSGLIDEVRIYNRGLTDSDIIELLSYDGYLPPVAQFQSSPDDKFAGDVVQFDASASIAQTEPIVDYSWDFGDETPLDSKPETTVEHVFAVAGVYSVTLTVIDDIGVESSYTETISISPKAEIDPIFTSSVASSITANDLTNWNESFSWGNHANAGYITAEGDADKTNELISNLALNGALLTLIEGETSWSTDLSSLVNDADSNPLNEINLNFSLDGTILTITDTGGSLSQDLASIISVPSTLGTPDGTVQNVVQVSADRVIYLNEPTRIGRDLNPLLNEELLTINGSIVIGDYNDVATSSPQLGAIRFDGVDLFGLVADEEGIPTWRSLTIAQTTEEDPLFLESPSSAITIEQIGNWESAFDWGDHSAAGYLSSESDPLFIGSAAHGITAEQIAIWDTPFVEIDPIFAASVSSAITIEQIGNWESAFDWGDHSAAGYLSSESDPLFIGSAAHGINAEQIAIWDTPFVEIDPIFAASVSSAITIEQIGNWENAFDWGDHSVAGYLNSESDPLFIGSAAHGITAEQIAIWDTPFVEIDPIFAASVSSAITIEQIGNWENAFDWGDHSVAGYLNSESDPLFIGSAAHGITAEQITTWDTPYVEEDPIFAASASSAITVEQMGNWGSAFGWGNHSIAGYLSSESDPLFTVSPAQGITAEQIAIWDTPYVESDPIFAASASSAITVEQMGNWESAFSWGNHSIAGYLSSESDPLFTTSAASGITAEQITTWDTPYVESDSVFAASASYSITDELIQNWNAAFSWGSHQEAGYLTSEIDGSVANETITSFSLNADVLEIIEAGVTLSVDLSALSEVNDADADPSNETNLSFELEGTVLSLTDSGGTLSQDLSEIIPSLFSLSSPDGSVEDVLKVTNSGTVSFLIPY